MRRNTLQRFRIASQLGFSFLELMVAVTILLIISAVITQGLAKMALTNNTVDNRTQMHSAVRSATELLQQEIGQAGKVSLPTDTVTLTGAVNVPVDSVVTATLGVSSALGMFVGEQLVIDSDANQETVALTAVDLGGNQIQADFRKTHAANVIIRVAGGFPNGVIPTDPTTPSDCINFSCGTVLKLFGDIDDNGAMSYIEYTCNTNTGKLYRNVMSVSATGKPALTDSMVLLPNIQVNPDGTPCFTYQQTPAPIPAPGNPCLAVNNCYVYVLNVAVTLTVQTEQKDVDTNQFQTETKALLNVSPRNVYEAWLLANKPFNERLQPTPPRVACLTTATEGAAGACAGT
jgi:prepilin-type N-terminal cleavage/methylation domain-containing protein